MLLSGVLALLAVPSAIAADVNGSDGFTAGFGNSSCLVKFCKENTQLLALMALVPDIDAFCHSIEPRHPLAPTVFSTVSEGTTYVPETSTAYDTSTSSVVTTSTSTVLQIDVTSTATSTEPVVQTSVYTQVEYSPSPFPTTSTLVVPSTTTLWSTSTTVVTSYTTATPQTATVTPDRRRSRERATGGPAQAIEERDGHRRPSSLNRYDDDLLALACACFGPKTITSYLTVPSTTLTSTGVTTSTRVVMQTSTSTDVTTSKVTETLPENSYLTSTVTSTATVQSTSTYTSTETVIVPSASTVYYTSTATSLATAYETSTATSTTTSVIPAPTDCGVNKVTNPNFQNPNSPSSGSTEGWTISLGGSMRQLYNSHCDGDVYPICLLLSTSVTGQYTLSQTVATTPGQLYTLSFVYNIWALNANSKGDVYFTGSETTLYPLNLATVRAYKTFSTTFTAQATTTTFNIKGSSLGAPGPNYQADYINFMGFSVLANC